MSLAARLDALKIGGNASFKEGMWQEALDGYKQGVDEARAARAEDTVPDALATLYANRAAATLYANRAAAALKLDLYEQAIHDTSQAMRLLLKPGASELAPAVTNSALFIKCAVRRAGALKVCRAQGGSSQGVPAGCICRSGEAPLLRRWSKTASR